MIFFTRSSRASEDLIHWPQIVIRQRLSRRGVSHIITYATCLSLSFVNEGKKAELLLLLCGGGGGGGG
jgi:hypothetical protein